MKRIIVFIGYLVIFFSIIFLYLDFQAGKPLTASAEVENFIINKGDGLRLIADNLENANLIKDKNIFILYTLFRNLRKNFLPGEYELKKNFSIKDILLTLTSVNTSEKNITLIEGWNNYEVADYLERNGFLKSDQFLSKASDINYFRSKFIFLKDERIKNLEGFIFPDTYRVALDSTPEKIILKTLNNFEIKLDSNLKEEIKTQGKSIYDIIILASIVEKEAASYEDKRLIAGIFWKRLANRIALQADSTINYATGKDVLRASAEDLKVNSLYNTYKYRGLPPGPICNPGLDSIKAVIYPQASPYFYFLNSSEGTTIYSKTFDEHKKNKQKYLNGNQSFVPGEILVKYKGDDKITKINVDSTINVNEIKNKLIKENPNIEFIEPNYLFKAVSLPNDPKYSEQWFLPKIGASIAWDFTPGGIDQITVALIDSGVDINHPDLKENIWINPGEVAGDGIDNDKNGFIDDINGWDFVANSSDPRPKFYPRYTVAGMNHGTVVAGLIAARGNNNQGVIGVAYKVKIMPIRVLNNKGEGSLNNVIKGIDYAIKNKADIINLSFVGPNKSDLLSQIVKKAWDSNVLIVAAAGNNSSNDGDDLDKTPLYPICLDKDSKENMIIGVTATDIIDQKTSFANYGSSCIDIAAPGSKMYSTLFYYPSRNEFKDYYGGYWSGTSVAAPLVSGTAALIKSLYPLLSNRELRNIILANSDPIDFLKYNSTWVGKLGVGRLNSYRAVSITHQKLVMAPHQQYLVVAPARGLPPLIRIFRLSGLKQTEFYAFQKDFKGGVNLASADLDGDGIKEIIAAAGPGGGPQIRIFNAEGGVKNQFFVYNNNFRGGVNVAAGDLNGDNQDEIVVAPQSGSNPIKILDRNGKLISQFYPYNIKLSGGISIATADLNGDGIKEIITGPGSGNGPDVRIFDISGAQRSKFFAYNESFRGGVNVAAGDLNGDGLDEIIISVASAASPYVRIFNNSYFLLAQFMTYDKNFYGGASLSADDLNGDGKDEIITVPFKGGGPHLRIFNGEGIVKGQFFTYDKSFNQGLRITTIKKFD